MKTSEPVLVHLLREGQWHEAVALYRDETGSPRRTAVREVKLIAEKHQIHPAARWIWWPSTTKSDTNSLTTS